MRGGGDKDEGLTRNQKIGIGAIIILLLIGFGLGLYFIFRNTDVPAPWQPHFAGELGPYGTPGDAIYSYPDQQRLDSFNDSTDWTMTKVRVWMTGGSSHAYQLFFGDVSVPADMADTDYFKDDVVKDYIDVEVDGSKGIRYFKTCHGTAGLAFYHATDEEPLNSQTYWNEFSDCKHMEDTGQTWTDFIEIPEGKSIIGLDLGYRTLSQWIYQFFSVSFVLWDTPQ